MDAATLLTAPHDTTLQQMQNRLLNMGFQLEELQKQVARVVHETQTSAGQVDVLTRHLTDIQPLHDLHAQLALLSTHLAANQEQLEQLTLHFDSLMRREQFDTLAAAVAQAASREQVERLSSLVAPRTELADLHEAVAQLAPRAQIEELLQIVANQTQIVQLDENFKRLSRTQFKANSLNESKEQQLQRALATLQELATRRAQVEEVQTQRTTQQLDGVRRAARGELAAELLPALDSLELALEHGAKLLARQRTQQDTIGAQQQQYLTELQRFLAAQTQQIEQLQQGQQPAAPGMWRRLFGGAEEPVAAPTPPPRLSPPEPLPAAILQETYDQARTALQAWLQGLDLVRQRFVALLSAEEIQLIDALHKPFDPRLHVAVETAARTDVEPNRVVAVLRKGYRQRERILRYAEVVVSQQPAAPPFSSEPNAASAASDQDEAQSGRIE